MCELKVINKIGEKEQEVAKDIIYAKIVDDFVLLKDVLGSTFQVQGSIIEEVNINSEMLKLTNSPLILKLYEFIRICDKCKSEKCDIEKLKSLWKEIKGDGDKLLENIL